MSPKPFKQIWPKTPNQPGPSCQTSAQPISSPSLSGPPNTPTAWPKHPVRPNLSPLPRQSPTPVQPTLAQLTRRQQPSPRTTFPFSSQPSIPLAPTPRRSRSLRPSPQRPAPPLSGSLAPPVGAPSPSLPFFFPVPRDSARRVPLPRSSLAVPWAA